MWLGLLSTHSKGLISDSREEQELCHLFICGNQRRESDREERCGLGGVSFTPTITSQTSDDIVVQMMLRRSDGVD